MEYVKQAQLDKIAQDLKSTSLSTLTGIMNVVAPPIAEHEVIEVTLSHDMEGYDGVESLVYRALARILEQVEGGDLVVNKGNESRRKDGSAGGIIERNLHSVDGLEAAVKLAEAEIHEQIKVSTLVSPHKEASSVLSNPTTYSPVYLRIQPFTAESVTPSGLSAGFVDLAIAGNKLPNPTSKSTLQFLLYLSDPAHQLVHTAVTQSIPASWLQLWAHEDDAETHSKGLIQAASDVLTRKNGEWIEDMLVEGLRVGVEVIGQEYVVARMGWDAGLDHGVSESGNPKMIASEEDFVMPEGNPEQ